MKSLSAVLAAALCALATSAHAQVQTQASQSAMTPDQALARLEQGNARFAANELAPHDWPAMVKATANAQYPFAAVLACMDSRAPIEEVFDTNLGDVFGIRVAGNVVNDDELGSLEYALHAGAKLLVVMGHTHCGAVKGALEHVELGNLTGLLAKIQPAILEAHCADPKSEACQRAVSEANVRESIREIRLKSPLIAHELEEKKVALVGAIYEVETGKVVFLPN